MKVYRSILLNEGEKIATDNIGCSWTLFLDYAEEHARDINRAIGKDGYVILEATVSEDQVDWDNTLHAMEHRPNEEEVVIFNQGITAEIIHVFGVDHIETYDEVSGNTGNNDFEDYCEAYEGEITKNDFMNILP